MFIRKIIALGPEALSWIPTDKMQLASKHPSWIYPVCIIVPTHQSEGNNSSSIGEGFISNYVSCYCIRKSAIEYVYGIIQIEYTVVEVKTLFELTLQ